MSKVSLFVKAVAGGYIVEQLWPPQPEGRTTVFAIGAEQSMLCEILRRLMQLEIPLEEMLGDALVSQWVGNASEEKEEP